MMDLDVAVVGAGFSGLLALHLLRERGLRVHAFDAAGDVGGTWWWHAYPGSHLDVPGEHYQYLFSEALYRDWGWSERYPAGYEVARWFRFVADRLDLRRSISLRTRVRSARPDDGGWVLETDAGPVRARAVVACPGRRPVETDVDPGAFDGLVVRTAAWPEDGHDLSGRRVGVLGTTSATVQLVPWIVDRVARLVVVGDGAVDVVRRVNPVYGWQEREEYRARFAELPVEITGPTADRPAMRARTGDARLVPDDGPGPVVLDDGYLEAFARDHVSLVGRSEVARVVTTGLEMSDGSTHELDVLVVTDAVDAGPPAGDGLPDRYLVVARPGRVPCLDLPEQVTAVVGSVVASLG